MLQPGQTIVREDYLRATIKREREEAAANRLTDVANSIATGPLRECLISMKPEKRLRVFEEVMAGFCRYCGIDNPDCQCWNDE